MQLVVSWPDGWPVRHRSVSTHEILIEDHVTVRVRPAIPLPGGIATWIEGAMSEELPPGAVARQVHERRRQSTWGWPVSLVDYVVEDGAGQVIEQRFGAFFRLLYNGAEVVVHGRDRARYAAMLPLITAMILDAPIDWPRAEQHTLHGLLGGRYSEAR